MKYATLSAIIVLSALALSCGPMNKRPAGSSDGGDSTLNSPTANNPESGGTEKTAPEGMSSSRHGQFFVQLSITAPPECGVESGPAVFCDNIVSIRVVRASDLQPLSAGAQIKMNGKMPGHHGMPEENGHGQRQPDGSYRTVLMLSMDGKWVVTLSLEDAGVSDEYVYEFTI